jgi:integrase
MSKLSRNTLKHIKSVISGTFTLAKQQDYFRGENPARDTATNPGAAEPQETYAYTLEEVLELLSLLPEPAATAFAVAAYMGLRHGEIQGLLWENYRDGELYVSRSIWNGRIGEPKTRKGRAPIPVIRQLAERLEMHRLRCGNPQTGPIFANAVGKPLALTSVVNRVILPALNRCERCGKVELMHPRTDHEYKRDGRIPEWHGWHAARRGLGSNLYRLGVPEMVIQRILRHANVSTTATYYIKTAADDVRNAMAKLENHIAESARTQSDEVKVMEPALPSGPSTIQ